MIRVKEIRPLEGLILEVEFNNGVIKLYDFKEKLEEYPPFQEFIANPYLFQQAKVDAGGVGVSWNSEVDISEWELWEGGKLREEASRKINVHFNKNGQGRTGTKINLPLAWIQAMDITEKEQEIKMTFDGEKITLRKN